MDKTKGIFKILLYSIVVISGLVLGVQRVQAGCDDCHTNTDCLTGQVCKNKCCVESNIPTKPPSNNENPFGVINPPSSINTTDPGSGIGGLIQTVIWILIIGAGVYGLINIILAGYAFLSAGDDPKKVAGAWAKIWQTALGLTVAAGSFILARVLGQLIFGNPDFMIKPTIPTLN
jgi:hypothetical protein